uniref:Uncharacterized protein n=1 Tax=Rhizophora mucronata TaxID=61149 RepID=A0A2P2P8E0_RHIMU
MPLRVTFTRRIRKIPDIYKHQSFWYTYRVVNYTQSMYEHTNRERMELMQ